MTRKEWRHNFSLRLRQLLIDEGISQMELAEIIGVSGATISNYINEKQAPTMEVIVNIAYEFKVTIDDLIDFGEPVD